MRNLVLLVLKMAALMTACTNWWQLNMPLVDIPLDRLNTQVRLYAPNGWNTFKIGDSVGLSVEVTGDETIIFPPDFGMRTFLYQDGKWLELRQVPTEYRHGDYILLPSNGNPIISAAADSDPVLHDRSKAVLLRNFVFGHVYRDGRATDEKVGAYTDVVLKP